MNLTLRQSLKFLLYYKQLNLSDLVFTAIMLKSTSVKEGGGLETWLCCKYNIKLLTDINSDYVFQPKLAIIKLIPGIFIAPNTLNITHVKCRIYLITSLGTMCHVSTFVQILYSHDSLRCLNIDIIMILLS